MDRQPVMKQTDSDLAVCEVCLKEIPASEAGSCEATDYVIHYWGLECYDQWRRQKQSESGRG